MTAEQLSVIIRARERPAEGGTTIKTKTSPTKTDWAAVWREAVAAGEAAAAATVPRPMTVYEANLDDTPKAGGKAWFVPSGLCGFATIHVRPATSAFARWAKKAGVGRTDSYYGGLSIYVHAKCATGPYSQSVEIKEAWARAAAAVLKAHGIPATVSSRLD